MKHMGAVESDSVKSARKAKDKLHKACERASETCERTLHGQEQNSVHGKYGRVTRQCLVSSQHTCTITCTAAPRVWHFSVFHYVSKSTGVMATNVGLSGSPQALDMSLPVVTLLH